MKKLYLLLLLVLLVFHANAQENRFSLMPTIGLTSTILDNGLGIHLGVNPSIRLTERISAEGQISYSFINISSSFISGNVGTVQSINTLAGGRFYFSAEDKNTRVFINLMSGLNYLREKENDLVKDGEFNLGFTAGAFVEVKNITIGLSFESPQNIALKLGHSF